MNHDAESLSRNVLESLELRAHSIREVVESRCQGERFTDWCSSVEFVEDARGHCWAEHCRWRKALGPTARMVRQASKMPNLASRSGFSGGAQELEYAVPTEMFSFSAHFLISCLLDSESSLSSTGLPLSRSGTREA